MQPSAPRLLYRGNPLLPESAKYLLSLLLFLVHVLSSASVLVGMRSDVTLQGTCYSTPQSVPVSLIKLFILHWRTLEDRASTDCLLDGCDDVVDVYDIKVSDCVT